MSELPQNTTKESIELDQETLAALDEGIESGKNGRRWTLEEAIEFARQRRDSWKEITDKQILSQQAG